MERHSTSQSDASSTSFYNDQTFLYCSLLDGNEPCYLGSEWLDANMAMPIGYDITDEIATAIDSSPTPAPSLTPRLNSINEVPKKSPRRTFSCPSRAVDLEQGLPSSCSDSNATTLSDLRRHLRSFHFFIERCTVCKSNIIGEHNFMTSHGKDKCTTSEKQPRLGRLDDSYEALFSAIKTMSYIERNSPPSKARQVPIVKTSLLQPDFVSPAQSTASYLSFSAQQDVSQLQLRPPATRHHEVNTLPTNILGSDSREMRETLSIPFLSDTSSVYVNIRSTKAGQSPVLQNKAVAEPQSLPCPLCTDKYFTGVWAHRNLTRHMEWTHAPDASSQELHIYRCSMDGCGRTFRRPDARLVHERRSHPELDRPTPTKRKRSSDL